jgi:hypothetical protein
MPRYRITLEFDLADKAADHGDYNTNPFTWDWTELIDIDDVYTSSIWDTFRVEEVV